MPLETQGNLFLPKHNELHLLCGHLSFHIVYIVETWLDDSVLDNELTIPVLSCKVRQE